MRLWWWGWWGWSPTPPIMPFHSLPLPRGYRSSGQEPPVPLVVYCSWAILLGVLAQDVSLRYKQSQIDLFLRWISFWSQLFLLQHNRRFSTLSMCAGRCQAPPNHRWHENSCFVLSMVFVTIITIVASGMGLLARLALAWMSSMMFIYSGMPSLLRWYRWISFWSVRTSRAWRPPNVAWRWERSLTTVTRVQNVLVWLS